LLSSFAFEFNWHRYREVQQLHDGAAALHSSRAALLSHSRNAYQRGDGKGLHSSTSQLNPSWF
jgi:hypothetical protein